MVGIEGATNAVYLIAGEDEYLREAAIKDIKHKVFKGIKSRQGFNYKIFYGENVGAREIVDRARSFDFLAGRQLILVRNFNVFIPSDKKIILNYLKNPSRLTVLMLEAVGKINLKKDVYKEIHDYSKFIDCAKPLASSMAGWIVKLAAGRKKRIEPAAVQLLKMKLGSSLCVLDSALEKLSLYAGARENITVKDIEASIGFDVSYSAFNFSDAVTRKAPQEALRIIKSMVFNKGDAVKLIGMIAWQFERIIKAKRMLDEGVSARDMAGRLNIHSFFIEKFMRQVKSFNGASIKKALAYIIEADLAMKVGKTEPKIILESLVFKLCSLK
ncbi:MAG: DNA polymerase III subunit delta [Candidatus Omnitrophica bacterium]|nr:DNA polymerase III subunit delta [Candidatus Omnitrophota bacterium]